MDLTVGCIKKIFERTIAGAEAIEPGGGVGLVNGFVAGDNCALLVL